MGDVIFLKKNEVCPADIVLLDSSEILKKAAICEVDVSMNDGRRRLEKKYSSFLTQSK